MGFRLKSVEVIKLNNPQEVKALAAKLKSLGGTESEREEKETRKERILAKLMATEALPFKWSVGTVLAPVPGVTGNLRRRVDGQHGSEKFLEMTPEEWARVPAEAWPLTVIWSEYDCDTLVDLPILFEQFDPGWSTRNSQDVLSGHLGIHADLVAADIDRKVADKAAKGMLWYHSRVLCDGMKSGQQYGLVHENGVTHAFLIFCGQILDTKKTPEMFHPATLAAMFRTMQTADADARDFWSQVTSRKGDQDPDSAAYKLARFLEMLTDPLAEWSRPVSRNFRKGARGPSELQVFGTCLRGFSAYHLGKKLGDVFYTDKDEKIPQIAARLSPTPKDAAA